MAYTPTDWKNREVERPRTFRLQDNPDGTKTLIPAEGNVIEPGTPIIAENMNKIEQGIKDAHDGLSGIGNVSQELDEHKADDTSHVRYGVGTGTNAIAVTLNPAPTALVEGMAISFKNTTANTGAATLNLNGLGAKPIVKSNGGALSSGNLKAGSIYTVRYSGTSFILQGEGGSGNATASDLLSGKTATTDAGDIVGTMPNRGTFNLGLGATVPAGYYSGGNVPSGKRFASGGGFTGTDGQKTVRGLAFRPSIIIVHGGGGINNSHYSLYVDPTVMGIRGINVSVGASGQGAITSTTIYDDGFSINVNLYDTSNARWIAFE